MSSPLGWRVRELSLDGQHSVVQVHSQSWVLELLVLSNKNHFFLFFLSVVVEKCEFVIKHLIFCVLKNCLKIKQILNWQLRKRTILALKNLLDFVRLGRPYRLTWLKRGRVTHCQRGVGFICLNTFICIVCLTWNCFVYIL